MTSKNRIIIGTWNLCNGLLNKVNYVSCLLKEKQIDVLYLQETEISVNTDLTLLQIENYGLELSISSSKSRIAVYVKNNIQYRRHKEIIDTNVIMLTMDGNYEIKQLCGIYRPFKLMQAVNHYEAFKVQLKQITDFISDEKKCVLLGDFNLDYEKVFTQNYIYRRLYDELIETSNAFNLQQIVTEVTWSRLYNRVIRSSILDHVYIGNQSVVEDLEIEKQPISDHSVVIVTTKGVARGNRKIEYEYACWRNYSKASLNHELAKYDWHSIQQLNSVEMADIMDMILGTVRDKLVPIVSVKKREKDANLPNNIIEMKNRLKNMYKRAKKSSNVDLMKRSRKLEKDIRKSISTYKTNKVRAEADIGPGNLWKAVNIAMGSFKQQLPDIVSQDKKAVTDKEKAYLFADYFNEKVESIKVNHVASDQAYCGKRKILNTYDDNWITVELVNKVMTSLKLKRCEGYDRIPLVFYVDAKDLLLGPITTLMRKIINSGEVPEQWKIAKVLPLLKKGKATEITNYRPISNLCSITKIFEKLILERIKHIEKEEDCDLTGEHQFGFKENSGTEKACLEIQSRIAQVCDKDEFMVVATVDMSAAFDVVDHNLLIRRLEAMGFPVQLITVVSSWLKDRYFFCAVNNSNSHMFSVEAGTVQGSILGPVLYALFTSAVGDLTDTLSTFADDNYQMNSDLMENIAVQKCLTDLAITMKFLTESGLKINNEKTEICVFNRKDTKTKSVVINGQNITVSKSLKILGVIFDSKLMWFEHVTHAINSANRAKQGLSLIARFFTSEELLKLATAYFYGRLYYGAKIWLHSGICNILKKKLWQSSSYMLQTVNKINTLGMSYMDLHKKYNRATPRMWNDYVTALAMYDLICGKSTTTNQVNVSLNVLHSDRRPGPLFTRSNQRKIGFNCISNRLQIVSNKLNFDWTVLSKSCFKKYCKKTFIIDNLC